MSALGNDYYYQDDGFSCHKESFSSTCLHSKKNNKKKFKTDLILLIFESCSSSSPSSAVSGSGWRHFRLVSLWTRKDKERDSKQV